MKKLNYSFKNPKLFELAMTQSGADAVNNNERLEFIGDRVLGLNVALLLYDMFPNENEGELARRHAVLVSTETLADVAIELGFDKKVRHGHMTAGRLRHVFANAMEATLGAIYLDGGATVATNVVVEIWREIAAAMTTAPKDPKTALQEMAQHHGDGALPVYEYMDGAGKSHNPQFGVRVSAMGKSATATGTSKKTASIAAAEALLKELDGK